MRMIFSEINFSEVQNLLRAGDFHRGEKLLKVPLSFFFDNCKTLLKRFDWTEKRFNIN